MWKKILLKMQSIKTQNLAPYLRVEKTVKQEDKEPLKKKKKKKTSKFLFKVETFWDKQKDLTEKNLLVMN